MRSLIGILLILGGIVLGYFGFDKMQNNKADIKIGDLEISANDKSNSTNAYLMMGGGAVLLIAGAVILAGKGK